MDKEKILKYGWVEFLKTPFSAFFFAISLLCILLMYILYYDKEQLELSSKELQNDIKICNENRVKDKEIYIKLIEKIKLHNELKKAE